MAGIYGADIVQLRALSKQLNDASARMISAKNLLSGYVQASAVWKGSDANRFRTDWDTRHRVLLEQVIQGLAAAGRIADANADEQEKASAGSGTGGGGGASRHGTSPSQGTDLTPDQIKELARLADDVADSGDFWTGNDTDVRELRDALANLAPAQLDQFLTALSDEQLRGLASGAATDGRGLFDFEGTTPFERQGLLNELLAKASPEEAARIKELFPWAQPDTGKDGVGFREPAGGLGGSPSYRDVHQQDYGDCGTLATLASLVQTDPGYVEDHVRDNGNGTVSVKLYDKDGNENWVTVTSDLPSKDGNYSGANGGGRMDDAGAANWPGYFEKAMAQVYDDDSDGFHAGDYRVLESEFPDKLAPYLSGKPAEIMGGTDATWDATQDGKTMVISTNVPDPKDTDRPAGLYGAHVYFVKGVDGDGNLLLGNPWGELKNDVTITKADYEKYVTQGAVIRSR